MKKIYLNRLILLLTAILSSCRNLPIGVVNCVEAVRFECNGPSLVSVTGNAECVNNLKRTDIINFPGGHPTQDGKEYFGHEYYYVSDYRQRNTNNPIDQFTVCATNGDLTVENKVTVRDPNAQCPDGGQFRIEEACTVMTGGNNSTWMAGNTCGNYLYDSEVGNNDVNSKNVSFSFKIKDFKRTDYYAAGIFIQNINEVIDYDKYLEGYYPNLLSFRAFRIEEASVLKHNTDGSVEGIFEMYTPFKYKDRSFEPDVFTNPQQFEFKPVLMKGTLNKNVLTYSPIGMSCSISATNRYNVSNKSYNKREINLLCFKNAGESASSTAFKSDIRKYKYSGTSFAQYMDQTYGDQVQCRVNLSPIDPIHHINIGDETFPPSVLDKDGNAVLFLEDFPLKDNKVDFERLKTSSNFDRVIGSWYKRVLNSMRYGLDDLNWTPAPFDFLSSIGPDIALYDGLSAQYRNLIGVIAVSGFRIYKWEDMSILKDDNDKLQLFFDNEELKPKKVYDLMPFGQCIFRIPWGLSMLKEEVNPNYTPVAIVYTERIKKMYTNNGYSDVPSLVAGNAIACALHEIAHGWFLYGSSHFELADRDNVAAHNDYIYDANKTIEQYCLMRYLPAGTNPREEAAFRKTRLSYMAFSSGVAERMRNVFTATYHK